MPNEYEYILLINDLCWRKAYDMFVHCFQGNSPQARAVAANLSQKLHQLKGKMSEALVNQVADDFVDIASPLKQMSDSALAPFGKYL